MARNVDQDPAHHYQSSESLLAIAASSGLQFHVSSGSNVAAPGRDGIDGHTLALVRIQ